MSIHKIQTGAEGTLPAPAVQVSLTHELGDLADVIVRTRAVQAFDHAARHFPIHRLVRCAVQRELEAVFDDLALEMGCGAQRLEVGSLLLDGPGVFIQGEGHRKGGYCSCWFKIWSDTRERADEMRARILRIVGDQRFRSKMFIIDWHFRAGSGHLHSTSFDEIADDLLLDEAYPSLGTGVGAFIAAYLAAQDTVLILQGPPGTGKTRLVRAILAALSKRKGDSAMIMYTADQRALTSDEIFVDFITGAHDAFVIEDADHLLKARTSGNTELHRFLAIADGVVRAQGRKIIFTTNLPNITDIDDALLRPGRCYAVKNLRSLEIMEANLLTRRLCGADVERLARAQAALDSAGGKTRTVAQVYRACA